MEYRFTLKYNSVSTVVDEPRDWKDFKSEIKRDFKSHGVIFKYTGEAIKLGFADGRDVLEDAFQLEGYDAAVELTIERRADQFATYNTIFVGDARMESRELTDMFFNCDFETSSFIQKSVNRFKTKVKLDTDMDLDGNLLSGALTKQNDDWQTISLDKLFIAENPFNGLANRAEEDLITNISQIVSGQCIYYFGNVLTDNLQTILERETKVELGTEGAGAQVDSWAGTASNPIWTPVSEGSVTIELTMNYDISITIDWDAGTHGFPDITINHRLQIVRERTGSAPLITTIVSDTDVESPPSRPHTKEYQVRGANITLTDSPEVGDRYYIVTQITADMANPIDDGAVNIKFYGKISPNDRSRILIAQLIPTETVNVNSWFVYDILKRLNYIISGKEDGVVSDYFGNTENGYAEDGCGALSVITNGYQLRTLNRQLVMSMCDLLDSLQAIYGVGYGFDKQYDGTYKLRVEPIEYFYTDVEILDLGNPISIKEIDSYQETASEDLKINTVEIGYQKFNEDIGINNIFEDFLTLSNYSLPIKSLEGEYRQVSKLIASNDVIQATFDARMVLSESWKYDESNFIIAVVRNDTGIIPENDQNFESVGGLDDPNSAYNIRFAPVFMFLNHALIINSALFGKSLDMEIQNTTAVINIDFNATFNQYEPCCDLQRLQRSSAGNISIGDNLAGLRLFNPIVHELTVAMSDAQWDTLVDSMEGENRGYLSYTDNDGNKKQGYLLLAPRSPVEGIAELRTLERANNYEL